ncbi:MAG TPA: N-acetyltransferase [Desulfotomaculum sp.]|nr:MAG: hypothetical protein JL56_17065 [Desulfotomaculum sp. BICA1-6]HBX22062.1 N-acetyltransferase [Desulfotomaculum sp.]
MANVTPLNRKALFNEFHQSVQKIMARPIKVKLTIADQNIPRHLDTIFLCDAMENGTENEFIIDLELNYHTGAALLYHITLPRGQRNQGLGTRLVHTIERLVRELGLQSISLPAEHHSTEFWLKLNYRFRYPGEGNFYAKHANRQNLNLAYDLYKNLPPLTPDTNN